MALPGGRQPGRRRALYRWSFNDQDGALLTGASPSSAAHRASRSSGRGLLERPARDAACPTAAYASRSQSIFRCSIGGRTRGLKANPAARSDVGALPARRATGDTSNWLGPGTRGAFTPLAAPAGAGTGSGRLPLPRPILPAWPRRPTITAQSTTSNRRRASRAHTVRPPRTSRSPSTAPLPATLIRPGPAGASTWFAVQHSCRRSPRSPADPDACRDAYHQRSPAHEDGAPALPLPLSRAARNPARVGVSHFNHARRLLDSPRPRRRRRRTTTRCARPAWLDLRHRTGDGRDPAMPGLCRCGPVATRTDNCPRSSTGTAQAPATEPAERSAVVEARLRRPVPAHAVSVVGTARDVAAGCACSILTGPANLAANRLPAPPGHDAQSKPAADRQVPRPVSPAQRAGARAVRRPVIIVSTAAQPGPSRDVARSRIAAWA